MADRRMARATSFDRYRDYRERGEHFQKLVRDYLGGGHGG